MPGPVYQSGKGRLCNISLFEMIPGLRIIRQILHSFQSLLSLRFFTVALLVLCVSVDLRAQPDSTINYSFGVHGQYARSSYTNVYTLGPALYRTGVDHEKEIFRISSVYLGAGYAGSRKTQGVLVTTGGVFIGQLPGLVIGIGSEQYYGVETRSGEFRNDIRLSGEVVLALFGFIGYKYQYPLYKENEARYISRHAFIFKIPLSSGKRDTGFWR